MSAFALVALFLAALGVYGVNAYAVTQRRNEIGLRMALGASRGAVLRQVIRMGMGPTGIGIGLGLAGAGAISSWLRSILVGSHAIDPLTFLGAALLLNAVGDGVYLYQSANGSYVEGGVLDVVWPASLILIGLAAWQAPAGGGRGGGLERRALFATPAACGLIAVSVLVDASFTHVHPLAIALAAGTIVLILARTALTFGENTRLLDRSRNESLTDALTGIGNRRKLVTDLEGYLGNADHDQPHLLVVFDLNGFKGYNDSFGHPAGDALLGRLAGKLRDAVEPEGRAYRMGGDEFCVLIPASETTLHHAASALYEEGETFVVSSAFGAVTLPEEAAEPSSAADLGRQALACRRGRQIGSVYV